MESLLCHHMIYLNALFVIQKSEKTWREDLDRPDQVMRPISCDLLPRRIHPHGGFTEALCSNTVYVFFFIFRKVHQSFLYSNTMALKLHIMTLLGEGSGGWGCYLKMMMLTGNNPS